MEKIIYDSDLVTVNYFSEEKLIKVHWNNETDSFEYRKMFQSIVEFAQDKKVKYIISDIRREGLVSVDDVKWLEEEVLKKAIKFGVEKIALICDENIFAGVYADTVKRKLLKSPIKVQLFSDLASAKIWLVAE